MSDERILEMYDNKLAVEYVKLFELLHKTNLPNQQKIESIAIDVRHSFNSGNTNAFLEIIEKHAQDLSLILAVYKRELQLASAAQARWFELNRYDLPKDISPLPDVDGLATSMGLKLPIL